MSIIKPINGLLVQAAWRPLNDLGLEHLHVFKTTHGFHVKGHLVRKLANQVFSATYTVECADDWTFQSVDIQVTTDETRSLILTIDDNGVWRDGTSAERADLFGCFEIDISATPFTNTLAIGRLNLSVGQGQDIHAAYIRLPELTTEKVPQRYTARGVVEGQVVHTYEGLFRHFTADLATDEHGLVLDYPETFIRV